jgi:hypothetical protein
VTHADDWSQRFQQLTADAGRLYSRSLRRYNDLLARVAKGDLRPEDVQRQFRDYLQEQGATATRDMVELSVALLAGLLHAEARYRDALLDGLLPPEPGTPPPPEPTSADVATWFQALSAYASEQSARSMARYQRLIDAVASGQIPASLVQEHGRRFLEQQAPHLLGDVMTLGLDFTQRLQASSATLADGLYDRVLGSDSEEAGADDREPPVCLDLRGRLGETASATFVVENTRSAPADVSCSVSAFGPRGGGSRFQPPLEMSPARFTLAPAAQQDVQVRLPLDPARFEPGSDYVATLVVSGASGRDIVVQLMARAEPVASEERQLSATVRSAAAGAQPRQRTAAARRPTRAKRKRA